MFWRDAVGSRGADPLPESPGGGRSTDPTWTERRLVPLASRTLERLEQIAKTIRDQGGPAVAPLQVAALLLERATDGLDDRGIAELAQVRVP